MLHVKSSGVFSIGISDHSLVYLIRKTTHYKTSVTALIEKRNFKNFNEHAYLNDLNNLNWGEVCTHNDPNLMWTEWLNLVMSVINKQSCSSEKETYREKKISLDYTTSGTENSYKRLFKATV